MELYQTYTGLLSNATKEATFNRITETEQTPQTILGDADGVLVIGVLKNDGIYHFYPVSSPQTIYASNNDVTNGDGASGDGGNTLLYWVLGILILFILSSKKRAT